MNHTVSSEAWQNLWFNSTLVGETGINAALCGTWGCPVLMVSGDIAVCREATELLGPGLTAVPVKAGLGRTSARQLPPRRARQLIEEGSRRALADLHAVRPYDPGRPCEIRVEFARSEALDVYARRPGCEVVGDRLLAIRGDDWWSAWKAFYLG